MPRHRSRSTHTPLVGFLRINRSVLAITATVSVMASVGIHDLPAQAATQQQPQVVAGQHLTVSATDTEDSAGSPNAASSATATAPPGRDAFSVISYSMVEWPIDPASPVVDGFGPRTPPCAGCSSFHRGTDFTPGAGTPIGAIANGVVTEVGDPSGELGVYAIIQHTIDGVTVSSVYGHMKFGSMPLTVGEAVTRGQLVGLVGDTGLSTGAHLHFGILDAAGTPINPLTWIRAHANIGYTRAE